MHGVISKVELINPHSWFWLDVKNPDGTVTTWGFEGGSPNSLIRHGVTKNTIPVGTELIIQGYQSKAFATKGVGVNMTFPDGRKFLFGGSAPGAETEVGAPTKDEVAPAAKYRDNSPQMVCQRAGRISRASGFLSVPVGFDSNREARFTLQEGRRPEKK